MMLQAIHTAKESSTVAFSTISEYRNHHALDSGPQVSSLDDGSGTPVGYPEELDMKWTSHVSSIDTGKGPAFEANVEALVEENVNGEVGVVVSQTSLDGSDNLAQDWTFNSTTALVKVAKAKHEVFYEYRFDDDLDDLVLGERRRMLVSRKLMQSSGSCMVENNWCKSSKAMMQCADIGKQGCDAIQDTRLANDIGSVQNAYDHQDANRQLLFEVDHANGTTNSVLPSITKVKDEPVDASELCSDGKNGMKYFPAGAETMMLGVKTEPVFSDSFRDELDHLPLADRIKRLSSARTDMKIPDNSLKDDMDGGTNAFESFQPLNISRPLKRKKTATDSVGTALEEDAPGLLQILIERGVLVEDIKLYGEEESDRDLDNSFSEDGFAELEAVMSQLFSQHQTFLKFPLLHTQKGGKISYCLACLLSLVEQTRYLQNRNWPVEWGWCRDLQSFIFVFQRHNRIVLERPEYGYATYFFELLNYVPVAWQIKRLVTAMKLTSCSRITLIENKPLVVGEDLSEGEARVLAEYGWTPNTGLGSMLNYCDRVVHDRKKERMDSSEWRSKIGRQLMNGYNGGYLISKNLPKKLIEYQDSQDVEVKLEQ